MTITLVQQVGEGVFVSDSEALGKAASDNKHFAPLRGLGRRLPASAAVIDEKSHRGFAGLGRKIGAGTIYPA